MRSPRQTARDLIRHPAASGSGVMSRPAVTKGDRYADGVPARGLPSDARRVLIYGVTGSGKSTLAAKLAGATGIGWHSVDDLFWEPGWIAVPDDEQRRRIRLIGRRLVCNGNRESWRGLFSRDAIIVWHLRSFSRKRERIRRWSADPAGPPVIRFTSSRQVDQWLGGLRERAPDA